jgi:hypothetical protein
MSETILVDTLDFLDAAALVNEPSSTSNMNAAGPSPGIME